MLFVFVDNRLVGAYPVAVGRPDWRTPLGEFVVSKKETNPTWDVPTSIQEEMSARGGRVPTNVPPGPDNPLGDRWIGVSNLALGIHGTIQPSSIYRFATHGCIRLHPDDARSLFEVVWVGMPMQIVYQPVLVARIDQEHVMVEVHADVYRRDSAPDMEIARQLRELTVDVPDVKVVDDVVRRKRGRGMRTRVPCEDRPIRRQPGEPWERAMSIVTTGTSRQLYGRVSRSDFLIRTIREEYVEMPCMRLTRAQFRRSGT